MMDRRLRVALALLSIVVLGLLDFETGWQYGFSVFYLIPILIVAWKDGPFAAAAIGTAAGMAWFSADYFSYHSSGPASLWNGFTRLVIYISMGVLTSLLKADRQRLQKTNDELEAFTYSVSHDLRAPLVHIGTFADKLQARLATRMDEDSRRYLANITESSSVALRLIDDLLDFSRLGRSEIRQATVDLNEVVTSVRQGLEADLGGRTIRWKIDRLPILRGDPAMLRLMLHNMLANAVKYTSRRDEAVIEIGSQQQDTEHVLFIRDNGAGFNPEYSAKLFQVFERLHDWNEFEGNGIGLAIAHRVVSRHHGRIWAEGEVDRGATFYVALPGGA